MPFLPRIAANMILTKSCVLAPSARQVVPAAAMRALSVSVLQHADPVTKKNLRANFSTLSVRNTAPKMIPLSALSATEKEGTNKLTEAEVRNLFSRWNDALLTEDAATVAKLFSSRPILLPTISDTPRTDFESIKDYFEAFLKMKPQGRILDGQITIGENYALDAGVYEFLLRTTGRKVKARYTFLYVYEDNEWKISHQHSSVMPESIPKRPEQITKKEVRELFNLWNDALATLNADNVAKRFSKDGVLLPTISDVPRTDYESIKDYFEVFIQVKPQGKILESNVYVGHNFAQDAGIYEFTLTDPDNTTRQVKARYSFVYVFEDDEWKILHQHSSVMPEQIPASPKDITESEVRDLFTTWNNAVTLLDADAVAKCYSSNPVLMTSTSVAPLTTHEQIKEHFEAFQARNPQGKIISSNVVVGHNYAQDTGVCEFTMGDDGSTIKQRYSLVYVVENGEWKISHHHTSTISE